MTPRERLQTAYELAFYPPRLHRAWHQLQKNPSDSTGELGELLDQAWLLHQALPEQGYASQRALNRLALYQAKARAFGMVTFLANIRKHCSRPEITTRIVPGHLVRDIGLPPLSRSKDRSFKS
ncbi:MAG: hypothetical protein WCG66_02670 [bacterium]